jgi:hypothetical protein
MPSAESCWRVEDWSTPDGTPGLQVTIDVPFALSSLAEAELDISAGALRLRGPEGDEVVAKVPSGSALDPPNATAKYSKKKRQLVICSPNVGEKLKNSGDSGSKSCKSPSKAETSPSSQELSKKATNGYAGGTAAPVAQAVAPAPVASSAPAPDVSSEPTSLQDDDDDDDDIPMLDSSAALKGPAKKKSELDELDGEDTDGVPADEVANEAAEEMMQKALAAREKKQKASEESRKEALKSTGGLKKGFFANSTGSKKKEPKKKDSSNDQQIAVKSPDEDIPYITGSGADPKQAKLDALKLPEVQAALKQQTEKMKTDTSWCTPQLMQALASRPDLMKGLSNPKITQAFTEMQQDAQAAKKKYENDEEVTNFLMEFSKLMATHFEVLGKDEPERKPQTTYQAPDGKMVQGIPQNPEMQKMLENPEVQKALKDPEVQQIIAEMQRGRPLEMRELAGQNPRLFQKLKILLDAGLFNLQGT